eukprot:228377_1
MESFLKQQIIYGYIRNIESLLYKSYIIPTSVIHIVLSYIDDHDEFISVYWKSTMTREIIHIQIGQCGNQIGNVFWNSMSKDHRIDMNGKYKAAYDEWSYYHCDHHYYLDKIGVYYSETENMRFIPRACCIDLEPQTLDIIKTSSISALFKPDNMCFGVTGAGNNWAKGHYTEGAEMIDETVDIIRKEVEACNCPQAFQFVHSIGGGCGSGMGTLLLEKIRVNYPDKITANFSVYPSPKVSDVVVEPYNAILSINQLLENSDETFVIDNEALFNISHNVLKQKQPTFEDLNWVVSMVMCGITNSLRFSGKLNCDLRKMGVNLIPFPRLHFFLIAHTPLFAMGQG